jgi:hypothetical protein
MLVITRISWRTEGHGSFGDAGVIKVVVYESTSVVGEINKKFWE